jgi:AraC family transcriptional regulator of adaptative response/methylated-DNA-[protein]-cysteine methyltransferase
MNEKTSQAELDYQRVAQVIRYLENNFQEQPSLDELAAEVHLSKYHFQRLFKQWAGVTPIQFLHFLTVTYAKERLDHAQSVLNAAMDAGLSGAGRLHDLFVTIEALTPGEYKRRGAGVEIAYGFHTSPFGRCLLAQTTRGICAIRFLANDKEKSQVLAGLQQEWALATFVADTDQTAETAERLFGHNRWDEDQPFRLHLRGSNFQVQVWQALLAIPQGGMVSYSDLANYMGRPSAVRAAASAVAKNPVAYLIPCHRVISKTGQIHNYRWGSVRKRAILGWEAGHLQSASAA